MTTDTQTKLVRPAVVAVVGHIDHGKSTLLDYIRKSRTSTTEQEAGGITQHLSAYVVEHTTSDDVKKKITFLDTPGHEAFSSMRERGATVADVAILVISAEEGVKAQTKEAYEAIQKAKIPFVVAITKMDMPNADVERTKKSILENGIYLEGLGGDIPFVPISSKTGDGIHDLLDMLVLVSDLEELTGDSSLPAEGVVIEAHRDPKVGISATLIIKNGTLSAGSYVVAGDTFAPTRILRDFKGNTIKEGEISEPVSVVGFSDMPVVGSKFEIVGSKKEAETLAAERKETKESSTSVVGEDEHVIPLIVKADTQGTLDAVMHEIAKLDNERIHLKVVQQGVGTITEKDVQAAGVSNNAIIVGFHVVADAQATELARRTEITIGTFDIIYKLAEWLEEAIVTQTPKKDVEEKRGSAKILKLFSKVKDKQVIGARVQEGSIAVGSQVKILRRDTEIGQGTVTNLQQQKSEVKSVESDEFGAQIQAKMDVAPGDVLESFVVVSK